MDGLPRDKIRMAKDLTDMIKCGHTFTKEPADQQLTPFPAQLRILHTYQTFTKVDAFDVIHYKHGGQCAAVALGYLKDDGGWEALLCGGRENVIEALEPLWTHTQKHLTEKFEREPLVFRRAV